MSPRVPRAIRSALKAVAAARSGTRCDTADSKQRFAVALYIAVQAFYGRPVLFKPWQTLAAADCNSATVTFSFFLSSLFRSLVSFSLSSFFLFPLFVSLIVCRFSTFARFLSLACCLEATRHFSCPVPSRSEQQQHACNNTQHQAREVHFILTILLSRISSRALSPQGTHLSHTSQHSFELSQEYSTSSLLQWFRVCVRSTPRSIPLARLPSLAMSALPLRPRLTTPLVGSVVVATSNGDGSR